MTDTYVFLIREKDWDSDRFLPGAAAGDTPDLDETFADHRRFQQAVEALGARVVGGEALQQAKYGGVVTPGRAGRQAEEAVYTDSPYADSSELITGFYAVECRDEETARQIAPLVPTAGTVEWRKVFPTSG